MADDIISSAGITGLVLNEITVEAHHQQVSRVVFLKGGQPDSGMIGAINMRFRGILN